MVKLHRWLSLYWTIISKVETAPSVTLSAHNHDESVLYQLVSFLLVLLQFEISMFLISNFACLLNVRLLNVSPKNELNLVVGVAALDTKYD